MTYCILCAQNYMTYQDMVKECTKEKWLPVLVMRAAEDTPIVPVFDNIETANKFIKRNLPKDWLCGTIPMSLRDATWMDEHGWKAIKFSFPRRLTDVVKFDVEILEYEQNHNVNLRMAS